MSASSVPAPNLNVAAGGFDAALSLLHAGRPVRRDGWGGDAPTYLYLSQVAGAPTISAMHGARRISVWVPGHGDLMARDWRAASASECR